MTSAFEPWRRTPEGVVVACRLTPKGGRDAIDGIARLSDGTVVLAARVRSPAERGQANQALCALIAHALGAPLSHARLAAGAESRLKQVEVRGDYESLVVKLQALSSGGH